MGSKSPEETTLTTSQEMDALISEEIQLILPEEYNQLFEELISEKIAEEISIENGTSSSDLGECDITIPIETITIEVQSDTIADNNITDGITIHDRLNYDAIVLPEKTTEDIDRNKRLKAYKDKDDENDSNNKKKQKTSRKSKTYVQEVTVRPKICAKLNSVVVKQKSTNDNSVNNKPVNNRPVNSKTVNNNKSINNNKFVVNTNKNVNHNNEVVKPNIFSKREPADGFFKLPPFGQRRFDIKKVSHDMYPKFSLNPRRYTLTGNNTVTAFVTSTDCFYVGYSNGRISKYHYFSGVELTPWFNNIVNEKVIDIKPKTPKDYVFVITNNYITQYSEETGDRSYKQYCRIPIVTAITESFYKLVFLRNGKVYQLKLQNKKFCGGFQVADLMLPVHGVTLLDHNDLSSFVPCIVQFENKIGVIVFEYIHRNFIRISRRFWIKNDAILGGRLSLAMSENYLFVADTYITTADKISNVVAVYHNEGLKHSIGRTFSILGKQVIRLQISDNKLVVMSEPIQIEIYNTNTQILEYLVPAYYPFINFVVMNNKAIHFTQSGVGQIIDLNNHRLNKDARFIRVKDELRVAKIKPSELINTRENKTLDKPYIYKDLFGVFEICIKCKQNGYNFKHHPYNCYRCYMCGNDGHTEKSCKGKIKQHQGTASGRKPSIINKDLLTKYKYLSLDLEKLKGQNNQLIAGYLAIIAFDKKLNGNSDNDQLVYAAKIQYKRNEIKSYLNRWSGLQPTLHGEKAVPFKEVKQTLKEIIVGKIIVGIDILNDFKCLELDNSISHNMIVDLKDIFIDNRGQPIGLMYLSYAILNKKIHDVADIQTHNPITDARLCAKIYCKHLRNKIPNINGYQWIREKFNKDFPNFKRIRN
ncbi:uncharacterized protein LOC128951515 [Oppia nitens]|uniref:uncharacterized protein LOC128951515 n=1 Tax=Oppia nitens TaxID=1686743 RepID=UPI0023DAF212|nr:uncharacterized protein LOC128951515 [Oppia nitens]